MCTSALIKRHILALTEGEIFSMNAANILGFSNSRERLYHLSHKGHSTSCNFRKIKIHGKGVCTRKISLEDDRIGLAIKALWRIGKVAAKQALWRRPQDILPATSDCDSDSLAT